MSIPQHARPPMTPICQSRVTTGALPSSHRSTPLVSDGLVIVESTAKITRSRQVCTCWYAFIASLLYILRGGLHIAGVGKTVHLREARCHSTTVCSCHGCRYEVVAPTQVVTSFTIAWSISCRCPGSEQPAL